jgi:ADP-heptose:LPS heptosyltransferase
VNPAKVDWQPRIYFSDDELKRGSAIWNADDATRGTAARRLLLNVSAGLSPRRWPDEQYVALIRHVRATAPDVDVIVIGAPSDSARAIRIAEKGEVRYVETPKLRSALALVATADFVVTPDTSIAHAASACRKPTVILFENGKEVLWGRYGVPGRNVVNDAKTLATLPLEPVIDAVEELLAIPVSTH